MTRSRQIGGSCVTRRTDVSARHGEEWRLLFLGLTLMFDVYVFPRGIAMHSDVTPVAARTAQSGFDSAPAAPPPLAQGVFDATGLAMDVLGLPFDMARAQYARAVQLGLLQRSMLASRNFTRALSAVERLALGPWARHV